MNHYMKMAIDLAKMVDGQTGKNPPVGAVIVKGGRMIGMGAHLKQGEAHAEVMALENCIESPADADIYVSLEPCNHHGKTPPCVDRLIEAGIHHVYYGFKDVSLSGDSSRKLNAHGIGSTLIECPGTAELYKSFLVKKEESRPWITVKCAMSLDGKLALNTGANHWISNEKSRTDTHYLRHSHDGIMIGGGTLLNDNPALTTRLSANYSHATPIVLLGSKLLTEDMQILKHPLKPIIFTHNEENLKFNDSCCIHFGKSTMKEVLSQIYEDDISSVLVEGGTDILSQCLHAQLFDDLIIYIAPKIFGYSEYQLYNKEIHDVSQLKLELHNVEKLDSDIKLAYRRTALCLQD